MVEDRPRVKLVLSSAELDSIYTVADSRRVLDSAVGRLCAVNRGFRAYYLGLTKDERREYRKELAAGLGLSI